MYKIDQIKIDNIQRQVESTIKLLKAKNKSSNEEIVAEYIEFYEGALNSINRRIPGSDDEDLKRALFKLLNCARGYMETSSDYSQSFLEEMNKTEKLIKSI